MLVHNGSHYGAITTISILSKCQNRVLAVAITTLGTQESQEIKHFQNQCRILH